ncbi:MAG: exodeoxyribonuclease VII large subunit, partial [Rhodocyclaceae bacterium]|nr:exodeoxyribonuclease VII large subunit [Rhodocyclaceae bacterium]
MTAESQTVKAGIEEILSVSALNHMARQALENRFPLLWVSGEISNLRRPASGHLYFALKDESAQVDCVMFRGRAQLVPFRLQDGLRVEARALVTLYEARGGFQLNVEALRHAGIGALFEAFARLRERLEKEGLFAPERRQPLPRHPRRIGIVTSPQAAALRDILAALARRAPHLPLILYPTLVQGEGAAANIAEAIGRAAARAECDVLIVARGGGSIEDLWAFNEEIVVRAAARSAIPLISAVGHETDTTLIDFAADRRAPTPTAAAEMAVPVRQDLVLQLRALADRGDAGMRRELQQLGATLEGLRRGLRDPQRLVAQAAQRLDDLGERLRLRTPEAVLRQQAERVDTRHARLAELVATRLGRASGDLAGLLRRLSPEPIRLRIERAGPPLDGLGRSLRGCIDRRLADARA